ncbi:hypothetical protein LTR67_010131 [Exophiala xenobiotica]
MSLSSSTLKQQADQDLVVFAQAAMRAIRPENPDDVRILLADIVSRYSRTSRDGAMRSILRDLRRHFDLDAFVDAAWLNEQLDPPAAAPLSPPPGAASPSPPPAALLPASPPPPPRNTTITPTRGNVGATERARALANSDLSLGSSRRRRQASPAFDEETLEQAKARERAEGYQAPTIAIESESDSSDAKPPAKRPRPGNSNTEIDKEKTERAAGPSKKALKGRQKDWRYVCDVKGCITTAFGAGDFQFHMRSKHNRRNGWKIHWANPPEDMFWIAKDEDDEIYTGEMRRACEDRRETRDERRQPRDEP